MCNFAIICSEYRAIAKIAFGEVDCPTTPRIYSRCMTYTCDDVILASAQAHISVIIMGVSVISITHWCHRVWVYVKSRILSSHAYLWICHIWLGGKSTSPHFDGVQTLLLLLLLESSCKESTCKSSTLPCGLSPVRLLALSKDVSESAWLAITAAKRQ